MNSKTTKRFWQCYEKLPENIKKQAKDSYKIFQINPYYPGLRFKQIHSTRPIFSIRITKNYRAIGVIQRNAIIWFWVGSHADYERMLLNL
jgi:hypothetical protein